MKYLKPQIVAEIGCNHKGDLKIAEKLIEIAARCGASYAKFQKRNNKYLLKGKLYERHPNQFHSYGTTYLKHREHLEFSIAEHFYLSKICKKYKIKYSTSVWEKKSAEAIIKSKINLDYIKVPSACNLDFELLEYITKKFKKKIHISLGMTTKSEIKKIVNYFVETKRNKDLVLYACTSDYPVKFDDICLLEIKNLIENYKGIVSEIAFSGHHHGIAVDISAYTLGVRIIERHFTLNRTWKGTDHVASLEPGGLHRLARDLNNTYKSLTNKNNGILNSEKLQRQKLKRINLLKKS